MVFGEKGGRGDFASKRHGSLTDVSRIRRKRTFGERVAYFTKKLEAILFQAAAHDGIERAPSALSGQVSRSHAEHTAKSRPRRASCVGASNRGGAV